MNFELQFMPIFCLTCFIACPKQKPKKCKKKIEQNKLNCFSRREFANMTSFGFFKAKITSFELENYLYENEI